MGAYESRYSAAKVQPSTEIALPQTWGSSPRGRVWVLREGRSASVGVGHISVLVDIAGLSQYGDESDVIPKVFSGVQIHLCLKKRKQYRFTRQADLNFTFWPQTRKSNVLEHFTLEGCGEVHLVEGVLDPLCPWEEFENGPLDWWQRLAPYLLSKQTDFAAAMTQNHRTEETDAEVTQRLMEMVKDVERDLRPQKPEKKPKNRSHSYLAVLGEASRDPPSEQPRDSLTLTTETASGQPPSNTMMWSSSFNSHTYARFLVEDVFHLGWPHSLPIQPAEYPKQFADVVRVMLSRCK